MSAKCPIGHKCAMFPSQRTDEVSRQLQLKEDDYVAQRLRYEEAVDKLRGDLSLQKEAFERKTKGKDDEADALRKELKQAREEGRQRQQELEQRRQDRRVKEEQLCAITISYLFVCHTVSDLVYHN